MASLAALHSAYIEHTVACYPFVADRLLSLPTTQARKTVSRDIKTFLGAVLTQIEGTALSDQTAVTAAIEDALLGLYGPAEMPAADDEFSWEAIEIDDRRRAAFHALVANAL
ncbi:MAG: hypothetical protein JO232_07485 [Verrucomicrobia bacterium]|nr:hypothetical protein [Verrucomicrobiota bacterium]